MYQKVLVTGASGFIGSHLCSKLLKNDAVVNAISRTARSSYNNGIKWWKCDLEEISVIRSLLTTIKPDIIFHLAGYPVGARELTHVMPSFRYNLLTTVNLLIAASEIGCQRFILAGSMEEPEADDPQTIPSSPYAVSKWASSAYGRMFNALYHLPVVIMRIFMVYGPGQQDLNKLIPYTILTLLREESPNLTSGQRQVDWIYVDDVVKGLLAAAQVNGIEGRTIDVGSGILVSIRTITETLVRLINPKIVPHFGALPERQFEHMRVADVIGAERLLGWKPTISLDEGLKRTAIWYRKRFKEGIIQNLTL